MSLYKNKKVAIIGLSVEGQDTALFFSKEGARITCCDRRTIEELGEIYTHLSTLTDSFQLGSDYLAHLEAYDLVVRTPGMSLATAEFAALQQSGKEISSATKLFFAHCKGKIVGITGTKGKGTTSTLIAEILKVAGKTVWLGGNVGTPLLSHVHEIMPNDIVVLELSSFQLEDLTQSPHVSVVLKITEDHLANFDPLATNYHVTREAYVAAKKSIVKYQKQGDVVICNKDDETSVSFSEVGPATSYFFSRTDGAVDAYVTGEEVWVRWEGKTHKICSLSEIHLLGMHNLENIMAATLAALQMGASIENVQKAVRVFKGLEHRLEFVKAVGDVSYYNDSFSTVPDTTIAAIDAFSSPIVLIAGGSDKKSNYTQLGQRIAASSVKTLILIGDMAETIKQAVMKAGFAGEIVEGLSTMKDIVATAKRHANAGDIVLLSPACASFGMFTNYKERGKLFKEEVKKLS